MSRREVLRGFVRFGWDSLPLTAMVAVLTGITVIVQTTVFVQHFGARGFVGWAGGYAVMWEFGPLLLGILLAARAGARNAAELALLEVGGQLEVLRGVALDPYALLVAPRVISLVRSVTLLSASSQRRLMMSRERASSFSSPSRSSSSWLSSLSARS